LIQTKLGVQRPELVRRLLDVAVKHFNRTGSLPLEGYGYPADIADTNAAAVGEAAAPYGMMRGPTDAELETVLTKCFREVLPQLLDKHNMEIIPRAELQRLKSAAASKKPRQSGAAGPLSRSRPPSADGGTAAFSA
jgi:hypothetical protein